MDISYFPNSIAQNASPVLNAMISALEYRGHRLVSDVMTADAAVIWSMLWAGKMRYNQTVFNWYRNQNKPVLIIEVGCLRRGQLWKIGLNGISPRHCLASPGPNSRRDFLGVRLRSWKVHRGNHILLCLQRTQSWQWRNMPPAEQWAADTVKRLRDYTSRPIVIRPHPRQRLLSVVKGCQVISPQRKTGTYDDFDFDTAIESAWAVINHNSHPGIQSVIQGIPAFVNSDSLAAAVSNSDFAFIENPKMPDREAWFDDLTWTEFTVDEIRQGLPLDHLQFA